MDQKDMILVRVVDRQLVPMTLAEWAARFNAEHTLPRKEGK